MLLLQPDFALPCVGARTATLGGAVREFVAGEIASGRIAPRCNSWTESLNRDFSRRLGERGWIAYHWSSGRHLATALTDVVAIRVFTDRYSGTCL